MLGVATHLIVYVAVNAVLTLIWLVTTGSTAGLEQVVSDPVDAVGQEGFWPFWVIVPWGGAVVVHLGVWLAVSLLGPRARARRRRHLKLAKRMMHERKDWLHKMMNETKGRPLADGPRWVAVMFTDIVRSTEIAEEVGDHAWRALLADHRQLVRATLAQREGKEVGTQGDGFLIQFSSPEKAVGCAVGIQQAAADRRQRDASVPQLRIGIHAGEAMADQGDLVGRVINLAYRVTSVAEADEIVVTEPVADALPPSFKLADRGLQPLKGLAQRRHLLTVEWSGANLAGAVDDELQRRQLS